VLSSIDLEERILEACPACGAAFKVQSESEVEPTPPEEVWHADESEFARALRQACWVVALFAVFGLAFWWFGIRKMEAHNQGAVAANKAVPTNPAVKPVAEKVEPPVIVSMEEPEIELVEKDVVPDPPEPKPKPEPNVEPAPPPEPEPEPELELAEAPKPVAIIAKQAKPAKPPRQVKKKAVKEPKKPVPPKAPVEVAAIDRQIQNLERRRAALDRSQSHAKRDHERKLRDLARKRDQNDDKLKRKLESMQRSLKNMEEQGGRTQQGLLRQGPQPA